MKKNISLIVGLAIPVVMVIAIALSIYIPSLFSKPEYRFVYSLPQDHYGYSYTRYSVREGKIVKTRPSAEELKNIGMPQEILPDGTVKKITDVPDPKLYVYSPATKQSSEISFEDAVKLKLDSTSKSPDGFRLENGRGGGFFPFFYEGGNYYDWYLVGNGTSEKVELAGSASQYYYSFNFIGWIIP